MKKRILFLGFLLMIFGLRIDAQTLKNIHRHNQPVLRIPTHLIDKVETADVQGAPNLRVIQFNGFVSEIPLAQIDSITHSEGQAVDPAQLGNLRTASVMGVVTGPTGVPEMNAIVRSPYGGEETRTDPNGVFFLNNILVYNKLGYITITKPGFHQASRSFLPLESGSNRVNVQLLHMAQSGTFSATAGGTVTSGLLQLSFPANAVTLNGQPYNGTVNVYSAALDPSSPEMFDQMPGELLGGMNDSLRLLRSFGMAAVELRDANMNELQLAEGSSATLMFNIPSTLQADAPETIDWWSFDETLGYWKHEGLAQKQGEQYIGLASHFSWWNCDVPQNFNDFHGSVNTVDGTPISDAQVNVVTPTMGTGITYTNAEGVFSGRVPKNQLLTLIIYLTCETTNDWNLAHSETINSQTQALTSSIIASLDGRYPITGTVVNCQNQPVTSGYVGMGSQVYLTNHTGQFTIQTCVVGEYEIRGFDNSIVDSLKTSALEAVQVGVDGINIGSLQACSQFFGAVSDIEGYIYPTVLIGNQLWMAENLRTASYSNGELIPQVNDNTWQQITTGAWCYYAGNPINNDIYGKLYNWYTIADPRGLCPTGWHVPSDQEWNNLIGFLDSDYIPTSNGSQSEIAGGKMKNITVWNPPNTGATNESGFTGLPGGNRAFDSQYFYNLGSNGRWWSSSESEDYIDYCFIRALGYNSTDVNRLISNKRAGLSVRCLRD